MQQLNYISPKKIEWKEVPEPTIHSQTDALVRPLMVARCDLDWGIIHGMSPFPAQRPFPLGHEFVAEVIETGEAVNSLQAGDRVVVPFQLSCGSCYHCQVQMTGQCATMKEHNFYGLNDQSVETGGALSDIIRVPYADHMLIQLPKNTKLESFVSIADNLADAYRAILPALNTKKEKRICILGGGAPSISLYAVALASFFEMEEILFYDRNRVRLEMAESYGAKVVDDPSAIKDFYPFTHDATGKHEGLLGAISLTQPGGVCTSSSILPNQTSLPLSDMYLNNIQLNTGLINSRQLIPDLIEIIHERDFCPEKITTLYSDWADAHYAFFEKTTKLVIKR